MSQSGRELDIQAYRIDREPFYAEVCGEVGLFTIAAKSKMPVMLKGPTGCGKTRFVQHMAHKLGRPLITVACHEDLTASDLVGRYLLKGQETVWVDGPLTVGVKHGAIVYLDEVVEARKDTTVIIHPLSDDRRVLPIEKKGQIVEAADDFMLVISYNPGYQSVIKDLKESTKQRFAALDFTYPEAEAETEIVAHEAGIDRNHAAVLVRIAGRTRNLKGHGLDEGASTRMLIQAGRLMSRSVPIIEACEVALVLPITDDPDMRMALSETIAACV